MTLIFYYQPITKHTYDPIAPVHFEELSNIWETDRRIPTRASRNAWSLARNLNPINVNSWWYRRRVVAQKFRIKIPRDSYELDVGTPPLVVGKLKELRMSIYPPGSAYSDPAFPISGTGDTLLDLSSSTCADLAASNKNLFGDSDTPGKGAYIHDPKISEDIIVASDSTVDLLTPAIRDSSPLPPSSPPPSSPSILPSSSLICKASPEVNFNLSTESTTPGSDGTLVLDRGFSIPPDEWKRINLGIKLIDSVIYFFVAESYMFIPVAELDGNFDKSPQLTPCQWSEAFLSFYTFPTWCFSGFRTAYDGSIVCDCLCFTRLKLCSDGSHSVLTGGLGDGLLSA